jgi:hypothetical protein
MERREQIREVLGRVTLPYASWSKAVDEIIATEPRAMTRQEMVDCVADYISANGTWSPEAVEEIRAGDGSWQAVCAVDALVGKLAATSCAGTGETLEARIREHAAPGDVTCKQVRALLEEIKEGNDWYFLPHLILYADGSGHLEDRDTHVFEFTDESDMLEKLEKLLVLANTEEADVKAMVDYWIAWEKPGPIGLEPLNAAKAAAKRQKARLKAKKGNE